MTFRDVITQVAKFSTEAMARSYAEYEANRWLVLGDNNEYWVTSCRWASWLVKHGYEMLEKI